MWHFLWVGLAVAGFSAAAQATVTVNWIVEPGGLYNPAVNPTHVPLAGGRREIAVYLVNDNATQQPLGGFLMYYAADRTGATAVGALNGAGATGFGTRFNTPDWDASTVDFGVSIPQGPIPVAPSSLGYLSTVIAAADPRAASHRVGCIVVDLAPKAAGTQIELRPANFDAFGVFGDNLPAAVGTSVTFAYVPEPGVGVLVLAAGGFMCRRRRCMW